MMLDSSGMGRRHGIVSRAVDRLLEGRRWLSRLLAMPEGKSSSRGDTCRSRARSEGSLSRVLARIRSELTRIRFDRSKHQRRDVFRRSLGFNLEQLEGRAMMAAFTGGNLVVYRVGDGAAALSNSAQAVFLDEYSPAGTLAQSLAMPTADSGSNQILTASGTAISEGLLTRSVDNRYLVLAGYDAAVGTASVNSTATTTVVRTLGRVDGAGNIDTSTTTTGFSANNVRGVASNDGTGFWATGANTGLVYQPLGSTGAGTVVSSTTTNLRGVSAYGGQLYVSTGSGSANRVASVGTGLPTSTGQTTTNLPGFPTSGGPYQFFMADLSADVAGIDTLYVADDTNTAGTGGISKYSLVSGSWTKNNTVGTASDAYRGLTASVSGSTVTLYATNGSKIFSLSDTAGYNANNNGTVSTLVTAATNTAIRGIAFAPVAQGVATTTALTSISPLTVNAGENVTFAGTVVAASGSTPPAGTIQIRDGGASGTLLASTTNVGGNGANGTFSFTSSSVPVGSYSSVQAFFVAGAGFTSSNSSVYGSTLTVNAVGAATTTTLGSISPLTSFAGDTVVFSGTVVAGSGVATPAGTVEIRNGGATGTLLASTSTIGGSGVNGTFSISSTTVPVGTYSTVQAYFVPTNATVFQASNSAAFSGTLLVSSVANYASAGTTYTQDFNTLASSGTSNTTLPDGWTFSESLTNANTSYAADDGTATAGNTYSYGTTADTDRAFGTLQSGSLLSTIGAAIKNNTGGALGSFTIAYTGEQWRLGAAGREDKLVFEYSLDATSLTSGTWTAVTALDFVAPVNAGSAGKLDGNVAANRTAIAGVTIPNVSVPDKGVIFIRWNDVNATGADDGLGVDDFTFSATAGNPNGSLGFSASTYDVAENAGNLTVTVNRIGGATGAITVNYATSNGTAVAGTDYTSASGTLSWANGDSAPKTFTIPIFDNSVLNTNKTINIALSNPTGGSDLTATATGVVTIRENEKTDFVLLNEILTNPSGTDRPYEYIELRGTASATLANWYVVQVSGNQAGGTVAGKALFVSDLSSASFGSNGMLAITAPGAAGFTIPAATTVVTSDALGGTSGSGLNDASQTTLLLFSLAPIVVGQDLDTNDDGSLDLPTTATLTDAVGWKLASASTDYVYGMTTGLVETGATPGTPDAATRFYGNNALLDESAWYGGDLFNTGSQTSVAYDRSLATANLPAGGAALTPGAQNTGLVVTADAGSTSKLEGNSGLTPFTFTLGRTGDLSVSTSVNWVVTGTGTNAASASDFENSVLPSGTVTFAIGESSKQITINGNGDTTVEPDESFRVTLSNPTGGATIASGTVDSVILTDDYQTFSPGDIVVTGINGTNPDMFSFVPLVDLLPGSTIAFTDNAYDGQSGVNALATSEGSILYVAPATGVSAGTKVVVDATGLVVTGPGSVSTSGSFAISTSGDNLFVYAGTSAAPSFIFGLTTGTSYLTTGATTANATYLPSTLTVGTSALGPFAAIAANAEYDHTKGVSGSKSILQGLVATVANWTTSATAITLNTGNFTLGVAPVVTTSAGSSGFTGTAIAVDGGITVTDADSANLASATISITGGFVSTEDALQFTNANGIAGSYNSTTGVLSLTGSATVANYQSALRSVTYNNTNSNPNTADRTITFTANDGSNNSNSATKKVTVSNNPANNPLFVPALTPTASGVSVTFNRPVAADKINLYDQGTTLGAADVTLVGATTGAVRGSLIFNATNSGFTFIKTGSLTTGTGNGAAPGTLAPDTYTLTLRSDATNGFADTAGNALRDNTGTAAGNYVTSFTVAAPASGTVTVGIPDFTRGYGQTVAVPASAAGLPVTISNGNNVGGIDFWVNYNPALLNITGFTSSIVGVSAAFNGATPGVAKVTMSSASAFATSDGQLILGMFTAAVPATALYGSKELISLSNVAVVDASASFNAIPATVDNAVHVAAFFGDSNGNGSYSAADTGLLQRTILGVNSGFTAFQLADPWILADLNHSASLSAADTGNLQRVILNVPVSTVPVLPSGITNPGPGGPDPKLFIPKNLPANDVDTGTPGVQVDIPINLEVTDTNGITIGGADIAFAYDNTKLEIASSNALRLGDLLTGSGFSSGYNVSGGVLTLTASTGSGTSLLPFGTLGTLVSIRATVKDGASGDAKLNLLASTGSINTSIVDAENYEGLTLIPAPTNNDTDEVDGNITIASNSAPTDISLSSSSVAENAGANATVGTLSTTDPDAGNTFTYTLVTGTGSTDNASFNISGSTLRATSSFDFEAKSSYTVRVRTTDQGGLFFEKAFTITVIPVLAVKTQSFTINSKSVNGAMVGNVQVTKPDGSMQLVYSIASGNNKDAFAIDSSTGRITILDSKKLPAIPKGASSISTVLTVQIANSVSLTETASGQVTVIVDSSGIKMPPTVSTAIFAIAENNAKTDGTTVVGTYRPSVAYTGQQFTFSKGGSDQSSFNISDKGVITLASGLSLNFEDKQSYVLLVTVSDSLDATKSMTGTVTINVTDVNEAPVYSLLDSESAPIAITKGQASISLDENVPGNPTKNGLVVGTLTATDPDVLNVPNTLTLQNDGKSTVVLDKTGAFGYDLDTGKISVVNATKLSFEFANKITLTFAVTDSAISSDPKSKPITTKLTVVVSLNDLNEAPVISSPSSFSIAENNKAAASVGTVKASDPDSKATPKQTLSYSMVSQKNASSSDVSIFSINSATGAITVPTAGALDFETSPSYTLVVRVTDTGSPNLSTDQTITINVLDVNEAASVMLLNALSVQVTSLTLSLGVIKNADVIGSIVVSDVDSGDAGSNTVVFTDGSKGLSYNPTTGVLTISDKSKLVAGKTYKIIAEASDKSSKPVKSKLTFDLVITA